METMSTVEARERLSNIVNRAAFGQERFILTRRGKALAAVISIDDFEWMEAMEDKGDLDEAREALREAREPGGAVPIEQFKTELGL